MTAPLRYKGRLPGVTCEAALPRGEDALPRLDVAGFVGFAERGPLNTPVALEDISQYRAVFGGDLLLARENGKPIFAHLPRAVQAFFDNGGRRCYAVRVAGDDAWANRFRLPGLVGLDVSGAGERLALADAAWVGRWSDGLSIGTQLRSLPLRVRSYDGAATQPVLELEVPIDTIIQPVLELEVPIDTIIQPGDLLRLRFDGADRALAFFMVGAAEQTRQQGRLVPPVSTTRGLPITLIASHMFVYATEHAPPLIANVERLGPAGWEPVQPGEQPPIPGEVWLEHQGGAYSLYLPLDASVAHGDLLRLTTADAATLLFPVLTIDVYQAEGSPPTAPQLRLRGQELLRPIAATPAPGAIVQAELLSFDLYVREGDEMNEVWRELRFGGAAAWTATMAQQPSDRPPPGLLSIGGLAGSQSARLRMPPDLAAAALYLPIGMSELPAPELFARALRRSTLDDAALPGKDGLDSFAADTLFLDDDLDDMFAGALLAEAERRFYLSAPPQPLRRLHSLVLIDEIGLIAVPDAIHRGWGHPNDLQEPPPTPAPPEPAPPPDWSSFRNCPQPQPPQPPQPKLCVQPFDFRFPPHEPELPDLRQQLAGMPVLDPSTAYQSAALLRFQAALIRLCAARADMLAVLSLPEHFDKRAVLDWQRTLPVAAPDLLAGPALSFAAVYHPWLLAREDVAPEMSPLRALPPDGAVSGMIAARELARGPWIAPANLPLRGVVGLSAPLSVDEWAELFDIQINVVRRQPGQFTLLSAHTLSSDRLLLQISVRRLLIFLRKLALRRGARYIFEPNGRRLRQQVQLGFERMLSVLAARGALAAYQVVTGDEINTPNDYDNGRFLIALKIAPTLPISFITITLLRSGEGLLEIIER